MRQVSVVLTELAWRLLDDGYGRAVRVARAASIGVELTLQLQVVRIGELPLLAGCVRWRTAASGKRTSREGCLADRQLCGNLYDRCGSGG